MLSRFAEDAAKPNFAGLLLDQDHFSYDIAKSSEAFGWIKELKKKADGIWARIEWTSDLGMPAVKNARYRFLSPVWLPLPGHIENLGNGRVRPLRLDSAGLTNNPNLKGMIPLANRVAVGGFRSEEIPADLISQKDANDAFAIIANRIKKTLGASFQESWDLARQENGTLYSIACGTSLSAALKNRRRGGNPEFWKFRGREICLCRTEKS